ncbi:MAG: hypothetical protein AVDCRST_MAG22-2280, partial [uncultured Rubrobacteraceae bacterium]
EPPLRSLVAGPVHLPAGRRGDRGYPAGLDRHVDRLAGPRGRRRRRGDPALAPRGAVRRGPGGPLRRAQGHDRLRPGPRGARPLAAARLAARARLSAHPLRLRRRVPRRVCRVAVQPGQERRRPLGRGVRAGRARARPLSLHGVRGLGAGPCPGGGRPARFRAGGGPRLRRALVRRGRRGRRIRDRAAATVPPRRQRRGVTRTRAGGGGGRGVPHRAAGRRSPRRARRGVRGVPGRPRLVLRGRLLRRGLFGRAEGERGRSVGRIRGGRSARGPRGPGRRKEVVVGSGAPGGFGGGRRSYGLVRALDGLRLGDGGGVRLRARRLAGRGGPGERDDAPLPSGRTRTRERAVRGRRTTLGAGRAARRGAGAGPRLALRHPPGLRAPGLRLLSRRDAPLRVGARTGI